ncbi:MAG: hypothetical protein GY715_18950 [Planctomycetes bacterium]|nr:hypothetical protein [Planctomycetota bacterium]
MTGPVDDTAEFAWKAHPAREHAGRAAAAVVVIAALGVLAAVLMTSPWWALLTTAIMLLTLNRFFFPSRFRIDDEGITASYPLRSQRFRWVEGRRFVHGAEAGLLSTRARAARFEPRGSMHVLFGSHRDSVIERIRAHLQGPNPPEVA